MIYLPNEINSNQCAYVLDSETIRVYNSIPQVNSTIGYTDYFINNDYISRSGSTTFGQWSTLNYDCIDYTKFTTNGLYRLDFYKILIMAFILIFVCWFMISKLYRRLTYGRKIF